MIYQPVHIGYFIDELYAASSFDECFKVYEKYIKLLGFDGGTYTYIPKLSLETQFSSTPIFVHTSDYPTDFLEDYSVSNFDKNDFTLRQAKSLVTNQFVTMDWREYELNNQVNSAEKELIVLIREEYQIKNAITILTMHPSGLSGTSLISSNKDDQFSLLKQDNLQTMIRCAQCFHSSIVSSLPQQLVLSTLENLTQTERDVLRHLASGAVLKTIPDKVDVTYKYAANLLGDLRKKFGHISRDRLMYLAGALHLLDYQ